MKYIVHYVLNDDTVEDWTLHNSLIVALNQAYYWLHDVRLNRCTIYKVYPNYKRAEIAEIYNK